MTRRRLLTWGLAALVVVAGAFAIGMATAPDEEIATAPAAPEAHGVEVPGLGKAASLPPLQVEEEAPQETEEAGTTGEAEPEGESETFIPPSGGSSSSGEQPSSGGGGGGDLEPET